MNYGDGHTSKVHTFCHLSGSRFFLNVCGFEPLMMSQEANLLINLIVHGHLGKSEAQSLGLSFAEYTKKDKSVFES